ncbi:MAG: DUF115 domain-containing protein [Leptospiraceae bacterium]|nr:DUF115 domain-containing protein [Leptospiraceae bacterium]
MPAGTIQGNLGHYYWQESEGHIHIWFWDENTKKRPLVSERDPDREALRILGTFSLKKGIVAIVLGAASLALIRQLKKQKEHYGGDILLVEKDELFLHQWERLFPDIFADLVVYTGHNPEELERFIENLSMEQLMGYRIISVPGSVAIDSFFYRNTEKKIKELFAARLSDLFTRLEFEERWIWNILYNIPHMARAKAVRSLFQTMAGKDALLVATGPSLRYSLNWLAKMQTRVFLACADSAYRVLHCAGITPHLVYTLDAQSYTLRHFLGLPRGKMGQFPILVADIVANPQVLRRWEGELFLSTTVHFSETKRSTTPGYEIVEEYFLKDSHLGDIQSGGSVATSLFDLLRQMNFARIILVGQDLAYTYRQIHTIGTHHSREWLSGRVNRFWPLENIEEAILHRRHTWSEVSLEGRKIPADYVLSLYRKWFAEAAKSIPQKVIQASFDGLSIEHSWRIKATDSFIAGEDNFAPERIMLYIKKCPPILARESFYEKWVYFLRELDHKLKDALMNYAGRRYEILAQRVQENSKKDLLLKKKIAREQWFLKLIERYRHLYERHI